TSSRSPTPPTSNPPDHRTAPPLLPNPPLPPELVARSRPCAPFAPPGRSGHRRAGLGEGPAPTPEIGGDVGLETGGRDGLHDRGSRRDRPVVVGLDVVDVDERLVGDAARLTLGRVEEDRPVADSDLDPRERLGIGVGEGGRGLEAERLAEPAGGGHRLRVVDDHVESAELGAGSRPTIDPAWQPLRCHADEGRSAVVLTTLRDRALDADTGATLD